MTTEFEIHIFNLFYKKLRTNLNMLSSHFVGLVFVFNI